MSASETACEVTTDLTITGKVAQFGRGAMKDISDKLLAQFVDNLNSLIATQPADATASTDEPVSAASGSTDTSDASSSQAPAGVRTIDAPEAAPIDLLATAGGTIGKMVLPVVAIVAVAVLAFIIF